MTVSTYLIVSFCNYRDFIFFVGLSKILCRTLMPSFYHQIS